MSLRHAGLPALVLAAAAFAACAAPYTPHRSDDAAKLRLELAGGGLIPTVTANLRPVIGDKCGAPMRLPQLTRYVPTPERVGGPVTNMPPNLYPRAGMFETTDAARSDQAEFELEPRTYLLGLIGASGYSHCTVLTVVAVEPKRQYEVELRLDTASRMCYVTVSRLEEQGGRSSWQRLPAPDGRRILCGSE